MERILLIEDDGALQKILQRLFSSEGYEVDIVSDAVCSLERPRQGLPAAVILDLPRPGSSRCDLCKKIADWIPGLPLVVLSGSVDVADKILLEMRADDYVTIPFSPRELVARLRALIRRVSRFGPECADVYVFADVVVDFSKTEITRAGEKIRVTPKEFKTLELLANNAQPVISRKELLDEVWVPALPLLADGGQPHAEATTETRERPSKPLHFLTVHGLGYKFVP